MHIERGDSQHKGSADRASTFCNPYNSEPTTVASRVLGYHDYHDTRNRETAAFGVEGFNHETLTGYFFAAATSSASASRRNLIGSFSSPWARIASFPFVTRAQDCQSSFPVRLNQKRGLGGREKVNKDVNTAKATCDGENHVMR